MPNDTKGALAVGGESLLGNMFRLLVLVQRRCPSRLVWQLYVKVGPVGVDGRR